MHNVYILRAHVPNAYLWKHRNKLQSLKKSKKLSFS